MDNDYNNIRKRFKKQAKQIDKTYDKKKLESLQNELSNELYNIVKIRDDFNCLYRFCETKIDLLEIK